MDFDFENMYEFVIMSSRCWPKRFLIQKCFSTKLNTKRLKSYVTADDLTRSSTVRIFLELNIENLMTNWNTFSKLQVVDSKLSKKFKKYQHFEKIVLHNPFERTGI